MTPIPCRPRCSCLSIAQASPPGPTRPLYDTRRQVYGVSWEGQILCCYDIITMPGAPPRGGGGPGSRSRPGSIPFGGMGASSMSFNDTLQVTVESESTVFFLCIKSEVFLDSTDENCCCPQKIWIIIKWKLSVSSVEYLSDVLSKKMSLLFGCLFLCLVVLSDFLLFCFYFCVFTICAGESPHRTIAVTTFTP